MKLSARVEVTLRDDRPGRTMAALWGISRKLLARHLGPVLRGRPLLLFGYSSIDGLAAGVVPHLPEATLIGPKGKEAVLTTAPNLLDILAEDDRGPWAFDLAVLERDPTSNELAKISGGIEILADLPNPCEVTLSHQDGGTLLQGPTAAIERAALAALFERIAGRQVEIDPPPLLAAIARERGLLLFRDLVDRADTTRAVLLHACGWSFAEPMIPRTANDALVSATEVTIGPGGIALTPLGERPIHEWLGLSPIRLALARGHLRSGDEEWR